MSSTEAAQLRGVITEALGAIIALAHNDDGRAKREAASLVAAFEAAVREDERRRIIENDTYSASMGREP